MMSNSCIFAYCIIKIHFTMKKILLLAIAALSFSACAQSQPIADFISIPPTTQTQSLVLPATHTFQVLAQTGAPINGGVLRGSPDFTGYTPLQGSSKRGFLSLNHEEIPGGITVFDAQYNTSSKLWALTNGQPIVFPMGTQRNCSGAITAWGTMISGEEIMNAADANGDGWRDAGWLVEIEPATRRFVRKIYAAGWCSHENATIAADERTIYTGSDNDSTGFLYKFVSDTARVFSTGRLYVLRLTQNGNGEWLQLPNATKTECNNTANLAQALHATNIAGIEDVEIAADGSIVLAAKYSGQVYRFSDNGLTVSGYHAFVPQRNYDIMTESGVVPTAWGIGNDNMAFDAAQNLWILQDGSNNYIWVAKADHTPQQPHIELFATIPYGAEPTGITFSPDKKFLFMSIQHPSALNTAIQIDAAGDSIIFNKPTTIVIARKENLGNVTDTIQQATADNWAQILNNGNRRKGRILSITKNAVSTQPTFLNFYTADGRLLERQNAGTLPIGTHLFSLERFADAVILQVEDAQGRKAFKLQ
jgi:uncharacterized protein